MSGKPSCYPSPLITNISLWGWIAFLLRSALTYHSWNPPTQTPCLLCVYITPSFTFIGWLWFGVFFVCFLLFSAECCSLSLPFLNPCSGVWSFFFYEQKWKMNAVSLFPWSCNSSKAAISTIRFPSPCQASLYPLPLKPQLLFFPVWGQCPAFHILCGIIPCLGRFCFRSVL